MKNNIELNSKKPYILIVDDELFNLKILSKIIENAGYETLTVSDGFAALRILEHEKPDIILLDIMMPGMDGYEVCRRLKENINLNAISVIFISSLNEPKDIVEAFRSGGVDYISKPFQAEEVITRVNTHLKLHQQSKELLELNAKLKESQDQLKKFAAHLQIIREEERLFLANEIHDKIGQILVALKIDMGIWEKKVLFLSDNIYSDDILETFNGFVTVVDETFKTARNIMNNLKSDDLELLGFIETAKLLCVEFELLTKIDCQFENSISRLVFNEKQNIALYRIMQEALSNIREHANATSVNVSLNIEENKFFLEIRDNGIGFDENKRILKDSYGILDMTERVQMLQGKLTISGKPGEGTLVKVELPYKK